MNPPIRDIRDQEALLQGLLDGTVDMIATDHAPHSAEEKSKGILHSAFGIVGLECAFPVLYSSLVKYRMISLEKLLQVMAINPRRRFGLPGGILEDGAPADIAIIDPNATYNIDAASFRSMGHATPFDGREVTGKVMLTICSGEIVYQEETL
jgi:dihydroorotase